MAGEQSNGSTIFPGGAESEKGAVLPVCAAGCEGRRDFSAEALQFRIHDPCNGNAGQLIEDEELRAQIKGSGIGTSATRAEILKKLIHIKYLSLNKKTQIITPTLQERWCMMW